MYLVNILIYTRYKISCQAVFFLSKISGVVDWYCNARNLDNNNFVDSDFGGVVVDILIKFFMRMQSQNQSCVNIKTRVSIVVLQTKLTTDTVIPDNVFDLAVGSFQ